MILFTSKSVKKCYIYFTIYNSTVVGSVFVPYFVHIEHEDFLFFYTFDISLYEHITL